MENQNHQILMLGGFRAGKSSILASILHAVKNQVSNGLFTITDQTDYTDAEGAAVSLNDKRLEISQYIKKRGRVYGENPCFLVDMSPTVGKSTYTLEMRIDGGSNVSFDYVDVPGEWMEENKADYNTLKALVAKSDVFIIAIDTPYMMQEDKDVNTCYNRVEEITRVSSLLF